jgi:hypothetical protein
MSYDKIWICPRIDRETWTERFGAEQQLHREVEYLYHKGDFVVLVHGAEMCIEELFLFKRREDAAAFYETGYKGREYLRPGGSLVGFQEISLYLSGHRKRTKAVER